MAAGQRSATAERTKRLTDKRLTDKRVTNLKPAAARYVTRDPECPGLYVRVMPSGAKSFTIVARDPRGKQLWREVVGTTVGIDLLDDVREKARIGIKRIKAGEDAFPPPPPRPDTFAAVAEDYLKRHVEKRGLRSQDEIERLLNGLILPAWQDRVFTEIRKGDITKLLDAVEDEHGARQADYVLAIARNMMNWYASRNDGYEAPLTRGMARRNPAECARSRTLSDDEIRLIWPMLAERGAFGALLKVALLTGQRIGKVVSMRWQDMSPDGVWKIETAAREKGNAGVLKLPKLAHDTILARPKITDNPYVFTGRGDQQLTGFSQCKRLLDKKIVEAMQDAAKERGEDPRRVKPPERWTIHDLRRTAKTLMMRAGVERFHAERVLGHKIGGVEATYDRHDYGAERETALAALAAMIERILNPPGGNVADIGEERARRADGGAA